MKQLLAVLLLAGCGWGQASKCPVSLKEYGDCVDGLRVCADTLNDAIAEIKRRPFSEPIPMCAMVAGMEPCIHLGKPGDCFRVKADETLERVKCGDSVEPGESEKLK